MRSAILPRVRTQPLPPVLAGRFASEPKWVDLRAYRGGADPRDSRFIEAGADFAAAIHGMPKEDLLSQEVREQKRRLRLAWGAAASLLFFAGLAGWQAKVAIDNERAAIEQRNIAEQQRRLAQEQRDRAERSLAAATQTANSLVFDLAREFRDRAGMPADLVRRILDRARGLQRQLAESGEATPALRRSEAVALQDVVNTLLALGDTTAALAAAERARAISEELSAADPGNTEWRRDLSISHNRIGDVLVAAGRREEALAAYRRSLAIAETLAAADPGNTEWQRDLTISHDRIGEVLVAAGRREEALAAYRRSLAIAETLAAADPGNTQWQRDLSISHDKDRQRAGGAGRAGGGAGGLPPEPRDPRDARRRRSRQHRVAARSVASATTGSATCWWRRASAAEAHAAYRRSLAIRETLAAADPGNTQWQRDLSISHIKIGDVLVARGERAGCAGGIPRGASRSREKLAAADPGNTQWQSDLSIRLQQDRRRAGGGRTARGCAGGIPPEPRDLARSWPPPIPATPSGSATWSISHHRIGDVLRAAGRREEALVAYRRSLGNRRDTRRRRSRQHAVATRPVA